MNRPVSSPIKFSEGFAPLRTNFKVLTFYESEDIVIRHVGKDSTLAANLSTKPVWKEAENHVGLEVMTLREAIQCRQYAGSLLREGVTDWSTPVGISEKKKSIGLLPDFTD
jgi:hypothetical protein